MEDLERAAEETKQRKANEALRGADKEEQS